MKRSVVFIVACGILALAISLTTAGCQKNESVTVGELQTYTDPVYNFSISYPKEWLNSATTGQRFMIFSSQDTYDWLLNSNSGARPGAWIEIGIDTTQGKTLDDFIASQKEKLQQKKFRITGEDSIVVAGVPAVRINYTFPLTSKTSLYGFDIVALNDSVTTYIDYAGVGKAFELNRVVIDTVLSGVKLGRKIVQSQQAGPAGPSEQPANHSGKYIDFSYPDNYNPVSVPQGGNIWVYELRSTARLDCSIHFDLFDAKKLTVEKVFDQNKGKYKGVKSTSSATIAGQKTLFLNYSPVRDVEARVYFVVKNDKVLRVTFTWYKPQEAEYLAAYDKVLGSLRLKF